MKRIFTLSAIMLATTASYAQEPVVSQNVPIMQNTTPSQCPSSWRGAGTPVSVTDNTAAGVVNSDSDATVRACTQCAFDTASKSCICKTCYDYYN